MSTILKSTFLLLIFCCQNGYAQLNKCGTADKMHGLKPTSREMQILDLVKQKAGRPGGPKDYLHIIPTVVHIIHFTGIGDISDAQVHDGLRVVNEDFRRLNADRINTDPVFQPFAADVKIEFHLAKLDPDGNPTNGIVRVDTNIIPHPEPTDSRFDNVKYISHWPEDKYFNIWLVRSIVGGSLGYAQYPGTDFTYGGPWHTWGPTIKSNQWGTIETSTADGRTGTHEIGHCFGLYHTFLSSSAGCGAVCDTTGDEVCDTPPCLVDFSCSFNNTCSNDTMGPSVYTTNVIDQKENYMSYNSCQNMFSEGQKARMRGFFNAFDTIYNLATVQNHICTGLLNPTSVKQELSAQLDAKVYPNPGNGNFMLSITSPIYLSNGSYSVFSAMGKLVKQQDIKAAETSINMHGFAKGIYHLRAQFNGQVYRTKLIIH